MGPRPVRARILSVAIGAVSLSACDSSTPQSQGTAGNGAGGGAGTSGAAGSGATAGGTGGAGPAGAAGEGATVPIAIACGTAPAMCTPNVTSSSANLAAGTAVAVTGGSFSASLGATGVTTFVCK
jgi:hypothetical protein